MPRRILLAALAVTAAFATMATQADGMTPLQVADQAWPASPCAGRIAILLAPIESGIDGKATGISVQGDGSFVLERCEITLAPTAVLSMTEGQRCELVVHEAGHLAGMHHTRFGVMAPTGGWYPACHTLRDRIRHDMGRKVPDRDPWVVCSRWEGRVLPCRVEWADRHGRAQLTWFRARTRGDRYAIARVRNDERPGTGA